MRRSGRVALVAAALFTGLAASAASAVQLGQSGWSWSSPQPQGHQLTSVVATSATGGYASGANGTLLSTGDGGATWTTVPSGDLNDVKEVVASGSAVVAVSGCGARRSDDGAQTFRRIRFAANCAPLAVSFPTATNGFVVLSDGTLLATADGGDTFSLKQAVPSGSVTNLAFASPQVGLATSTIGAIFRTADAGATWSKVFDAGLFIGDVTFADATTAYAVGSGRIHKSTDAGVTWTTLATTVASPADPTVITCVSPTRCIGANGRTSIVQTDDGFATVKTVSLPGTEVASVAFFTPTRVVAVGKGDTIATSDDAGLTWRALGSRLARPTENLRATRDGVAVTWGAAGALSTSVDGGVTWRNGGVATTVAINGASFASGDVGYAVDTAGTVFKSINGGASWAILNVDDPFTPVDVIAVTPDRVVLLGLDGSLRRSGDGGRTFSDITLPKGVRTVRSIDRAGGALFFQAASGIFASGNGGATWRAIASPKVGTRVQRIRAATCMSAGACWAVTSANRLMLTVNGGRTWIDRTAGLGSTSVARMSFSDRNRGYVIPARTDLPGDTVLRTTDGGLSWTPGLLPANADLVAATPGVDYLLSQGNVFTTTTGGQRGTPSTLTLTPSVAVVRGRTTVTLRGRLSPASGGEKVIVSRGAGGFAAQTATVAANGSFTAQFVVTKTSTFVAQWSGDATRAGDGSPAVTVTRR